MDERTDVWKFTPVSYRTSALWDRCPKRLQRDGPTDGPTDLPTDTAKCRVACPRLKTIQGVASAGLVSEASQGALPTTTIIKTTSATTSTTSITTTTHKNCLPT